MAVQFLPPSVRVCQFAQGSFSLHYLRDYCARQLLMKASCCTTNSFQEIVVSRGQRLITKLETAPRFQTIFTQPSCWGAIVIRWWCPVVISWYFEILCDATEWNSHMMVLYTVLGVDSKNTMVIVWYTDTKGVEETLYFRPYEMRKTWTESLNPVIKMEFNVYRH